MIDLNDFKHFKVKNKDSFRNNKLYRHNCNSCGNDLGYLPKCYNRPSCNKCSKIGSIVSDETKQKMSFASIKRYNDPNWKPKNRSKVGHSRNRTRIYEQKSSTEQRKIKHNMRTLLRNKLKSKSLNKIGCTFDILGYSANDLIKHLESLFQPGMTWENYGKNGWEIDHVVPDSWFDYKTIKDEDFKKSWSLSNLQPLWSTENRAKGARYAKSGITKTI